MKCASIIANQVCSAAARWSLSVHLLSHILFAECLLLSQGAVVLVLWYGGSLVNHGALNVGILTGNK